MEHGKTLFLAQPALVKLGLTVVYNMVASFPTGHQRCGFKQQLNVQTLAGNHAVTGFAADFCQSSG